MIHNAREQDFDAVLELRRLAASTATVSDTDSGLARLLARDPQALLLADAQGAIRGSAIAS